MHSCLYDEFSLWGDFIILSDTNVCSQLQNSSRVGAGACREEGNGEGGGKTAGRNPGERERGTETIAVFSDGTFGSNSRHYLK